MLVRDSSYVGMENILCCVEAMCYSLIYLDFPLEKKFPRGIIVVLGTNSLTGIQEVHPLMLHLERSSSMLWCSKISANWFLVSPFEEILSFLSFQRLIADSCLS